LPTEAGLAFRKTPPPGPRHSGPPALPFLLMAACWTLAIFALGGWNYYQARQAALENARTAARHSFGKDLTFRRWAAAHGGVYVPTSKTTPPNPHLAHLAERDIQTPSGRRLTLVNPAYMIRQVHTLADRDFGVRGHLTSLMPLRPDNAPDSWETAALKRLEQGQAEEWSLERLDDGPYLRLMRPIVMEQGCLKCHGRQGFKVGAVRGGISVSVPWEPYRRAMQAVLPGYLLGYGGLWALGLLGIGCSRRQIHTHLLARRHNEQRLQHWHDLMHTIIQHDPNAIAVLDRELQYLFVSDRFLADYRVGERQVIGRRHYEVFPDIPEKWREVHRRALAGEVLCGAEDRFPRQDGSIDWTRWECRPWHDGNGEIGGIILYTEVITERKMMAEELQLRSRELQERNAELERFIYTVSHDLKSPLVTVKSFLGFLEQDLADGDAENIAKDLRFMRDATARMGQLLEELLELSRIGRLVNPPVALSFHDLVQEVADLLAGRILERQVAVDIQDAGDLHLFGDAPRLREIWQNLMENAIKYMGVQPRPRIEVGARGSGAETVFFVRDNGVGIEPQYAEKIFCLFEKLDRQSEGSGLGLALVKRIVELYKGRIWLESDGSGQGSCFRFTLPEAFNHPSEGEA